MAIAINSAGVKVYYGPDSTISKGTEIVGIKEIPEFNPTPETLECTTLSDEEYKQYIEGLKDLGGALSFTVNFTDKFMKDYDSLITSQTDDGLFIMIEIPEFSKYFAVKGKFSKLGLPSIGVNQVLESTFHFLPTEAPKWIDVVGV